MENKKKNPFFIIEIVIVSIMIVAIAFMLVVYFSFRDSGKIPKFFGYYIYQTHAVNMETRIPEGTAVFAKESEIANIKPGSVILCKIDNSITLITVVNTIEEDNEKFYVVKYETTPANETYKIPSESVIAKAVMHDEFIGKALDFIISRNGIIVLIIIPSTIIVIFQIIMLSTKKRKSEEDNSIKKDEAFDNFFESENEINSDENFALDSVNVNFSDETDTQTTQNEINYKRNGLADYVKKATADEVLITNQKLDEKHGKKVDVANATQIKGYANEPVKIQDNNNISEELKEDFSAIFDMDVADKIDLSSSSSEVIPKSMEEISNIATENRFKKATQENDEHNVKVEDFIKEYYQPDTTNQANSSSTNNGYIPEKAVVPQGSIAPRKKKNNSQTIEELMNLIDAEQQKIKSNK